MAKKEPSEQQIAAALRDTGPFGPMSKWLFTCRKTFQQLWLVNEAAKSNSIVTTDEPNRVGIDKIMTEMRIKFPQDYELFCYLLDIMNHNPIFSWIMSILSVFAKTGLKVYRPNPVLAEMLAETEMTVLSEDMRLPFTCIALEIPPNLRNKAPITIETEAWEIFDNFPDWVRNTYHFPSREKFGSLTARYLLIREEPKTEKSTRAITLGLIPFALFPPELFLIEAGLVKT